MKAQQNGEISKPAYSQSLEIPPFCRLGLITNWATFGKEVLLENCEEILHLPLFPMHVEGYEFAIIFRPKREKLDWFQKVF